MCLAVPGEIQKIVNDPIMGLKGEVNFGGILREISLDCVTEAQVGDFIIAHAGVALQILERGEAEAILKELDKMSLDL